MSPMDETSIPDEQINDALRHGFGERIADEVIAATPSNVGSPNVGEGVERARRTYGAWLKAVARYDVALKSFDAADRRVVHAGDRCAALYSRLAKEAIEALVAGLRL